MFTPKIKIIIKRSFSHNIPWETKQKSIIIKIHEVNTLLGWSSVYASIRSVSKVFSAAWLTLKYFTCLLLSSKWNGGSKKILKRGNGWLGYARMNLTAGDSLNNREIGVFLQNIWNFIIVTETCRNNCFVNTGWLRLLCAYHRQLL